MVEEAEKLLKQVPTISQLKRYGIEYAVIARYLKGEIDRVTMEEEIITQSMRYAKRQITWNKKYLPYATVVEVDL
jgi:tRNA A37 N6-isopentenylltransferase MiaA